MNNEKYRTDEEYYQIQEETEHDIQYLLESAGVAIELYTGSSKPQIEWLQEEMDKLL